MMWRSAMRACGLPTARAASAHHRLPFFKNVRQCFGTTSISFVPRELPSNGPEFSEIKAKAAQYFSLSEPVIAKL
jgi:hypothetical protein